MTVPVPDGDGRSMHSRLDGGGMEHAWPLQGRILPMPGYLLSGLQRPLSHALQAAVHSHSLA